jgi:hypothetical protein
MSLKTSGGFFVELFGNPDFVAPQSICFSRLLIVPSNGITEFAGHPDISTMELYFVKNKMTAKSRRGVSRCG